MRLTVFLISTFLLFSTTTNALAGDPLILTSPSNGSIVSSSSLNWQVPSYQLYSSNPYRIQVDNDQTFSSPDKDYYTKNTYYTPTLNYGIWYWRVKAKDNTGTWSDWSSIWSFNLQANTQTPTPTVTQTPTSTVTQSPSPTNSPSTFTVSNVPSQVSSDQIFTVNIQLNLPSNPNTNLYLKGAFKKADSSNYFGLTKVSSEWIKNNSTYVNQFPITTDFSGNWSGNLDIKPDSSDSGFTGSGDYIFKVGRYTNSGSGPTWSNESTISITGNTGQTSNTTSQITSTAKPTAKVGYTLSSSILGQATFGAILESTPAAEITKIQSTKQLPFIFYLGIFLALCGLGSLTFILLKFKLKF